MQDYASLLFPPIMLIVGFGLGWYVKGRGMTGVKIDLDNVKKEIEDLKNKLVPAS